MGIMQNYNKKPFNLFVGLIIYNYDKIISFYEQLEKLLFTNKYRFRINIIRLISAAINDAWNRYWKNLSLEWKQLWWHKWRGFGMCSVSDVSCQRVWSCISVILTTILQNWGKCSVRSKIWNTKCQLFTELKFINRRIIHCLYWTLAGTRKKIVTKFRNTKLGSHFILQNFI